MLRTLVREARESRRGFLSEKRPAQGRLSYGASRPLRAVLGTRAGEHRPAVHLWTTLKRSYPSLRAPPAHAISGLASLEFQIISLPRHPLGIKRKKKRKKKEVELEIKKEGGKYSLVTSFRYRSPLPPELAPFPPHE